MKIVIDINSNSDKERVEHHLREWLNDNFMHSKEAKIEIEA